ncbi:peptide/nickel transport system substrate-binding protein [Devosia enhydra]|uniref:Peptide/nickel transport system substrate-binding protein n=1 Tax=Devosia enhydra TaxID=665118 RepID=A0A1K2I289_9HYPH|nr:ABC transporter substrate-binding protein [Devosia enhydra]SFZ86506.1 peptide/nickel transport system substrate-binding protein [Devosia enhydra]
MRMTFLPSLRVMGVALMAASAPLSLTMGSTVLAQDLQTGTLRVGTLNDIANYDPQQFSTINFPLIKNLYDSLIEYTENGEPVPSLAESWEIAEDNRSVTVTLRDDVTFHSGKTMTSADVDATLQKGANPERGKNVFATMAVVENWETPDATTVKLNFKQAVPDKQILDLLQFLIVLEAEGVDNIEAVPAGTGPFKLANRVVGQSITLEANENYWREGEPILEGVEFTVFTEDASMTAALESDALDLIYNGSSRAAVRLRDAGYTVVAGPGKLVQVFRINTTRGPFQNESFRQAFNYLMDRDAILRVGYAGLGEVTALPWAPASPAADPAYNETYAYNLDKAKELLDASGLSDAEKSDWTILTNGGQEDAVAISQIVQGSLAEIGINVELDVRQSAEFTTALLAGDFFATFGGVGNVQKFPSRVATNSIYRTVNNPVLKDPHPHPEYVAAIEQVNSAFGEDVQAAYDNLNKVLVESAFGIPTNSYETGLIVAAPDVGGFTLDIDNLLVARTLGFTN